MAGYQGLKIIENNAETVVVSDVLTPTPSIIKELESLGGYKEDERVSAKNTIYVFYDPTCPGCHTVFNASKKKMYVKEGLTIKWIPTTILGDEESSVAAAIYGLTVKNDTGQEKIFSNNKPSGDISKENVTKIATNNEYLRAYSTLNTGILAVPTVLYMNPKGGNVVVSYNIPDDKYLLRVIDGVS